MSSVERHDSAGGGLAMAARGRQGAVPIVETRGLSAGYGGIAVVRGLDLSVHAGEIVALLGPNGAGKSTTVLTLAGELQPIDGEVSYKGDKQFAPLHRRAQAGVGYVGEDRTVLMSLTVAENLRVARADTTRTYELFPELEPLRDRRVGLLSGGEQQMLALARVMSRPISLLLADELSLGLAPLVVDRLMEVVRRTARERDLAVLLVEQHLEKALQVADHVYVLRRGEIVMKGSTVEVRERMSELHASYLSE